MHNPSDLLKSKFTVEQVAQAAYARATGDAPADYVMPLEDVEQHDVHTGDGLQDFICRETNGDEIKRWDGTKPQSQDHWEEAIHRMNKVVKEVTAVRDALQEAYEVQKQRMRWT